MNPLDLKYSEEHEWIRVKSGGVGVVGVTEFATESLGDVVFLDLPELDTELAQFEKLGEIESVKAVSDLYSPISGRVVTRNEEAIANPQLVNDAPFGAGWLIEVAFGNVAELDNLMTAEQYDAFLAAQDQ